MAIKIYTKTGDKGTTSLIGGTKVSKAHIRIETYGTVDELNSWIGMVNDQIKHKHSKKILKEIQDRLFTIGSSLACDPEKETKMKIPDLNESDIELLEKEMDRMNEKMPEMRSFILPGGHMAISSAHVARCVCRRSERLCVSLHEQNMFVDPLVIKYLNRLSGPFYRVPSKGKRNSLEAKGLTLAFICLFRKDNFCFYHCVRKY
jgi:cob(I)alamin adenosyltransferase